MCAGICGNDSLEVQGDHAMAKKAAKKEVKKAKKVAKKAAK